MNDADKVLKTTADVKQYGLCIYKKKKVVVNIQRLTFGEEEKN